MRGNWHWTVACMGGDPVSKLYLQINHPSKTSISYTISGIAQLPKASCKAPDAQFVIHNGKLYPVRPEVQ